MGGGCEGKLNDLVDAMAAQPDFDVYHQKLCYFEGLDSIGCCSDHDACVAGCGTSSQCLQDCDTAFQESLQGMLDLYTSTMNGLEAAYPSKTLVWWTIPYAISDEKCAHEFNAALRQYAASHAKMLFDIGSIEAHDPSGALVTINGHESAHPYYCGEYAHNQDAQACHPSGPYDVDWDADGAVEPECGEGGNIRLAKAWWDLFARLAGWSP